MRIDENRWRRRAAGTSAGLIALLCASLARATEEPDPLAKLRRTDAQIHAAVNRRVPDWSREGGLRRMQIDRLLLSLLDYDAIARHALGDSFSRLPVQQRRAFVTSFSALTAKTFLAKMESRRTRTIYDSETITGGTARVLARATVPGTARAARARVEYILGHRQGQWRVTDMVIDGVSLIDCYQRQLRPLLAREGIDGLLIRMRDKLSDYGNELAMQTD
jgi:phospholipid transport system substrate-binding protein